MGQANGSILFSCCGGTGIASLREVVPVDSVLNVALRREHLSLLKENPENVHGFWAVIKDKRFSGGILQILLSYGDNLELISSKQGLDSDLTVGDKVFVTWNPDNAVPVDLDGEK